MIEVSHLTKYYGDFPAVTDLSFEIPDDGHVYGFLGPNGAGKSTTMNIMTGCLSPTDGTVKIGGFDILEQPREAKRLIGYLPELPPLYPNETPDEYLTFVGEAKGLRGKALKASIESAVQSSGISGVRNRLIGTLSKGFKQRVGIAQALLGDPQVIILDEPTVGLDPIQIIEIRDFIKELGKSHTVILSSHILSEVQAVCDRVLIISKGKLVAFDAPENLEKLMLSSGGATFRVEAGKADAERILGKIEYLEKWNVAEDSGTCNVSVSVSDGAELKEVCGKITLAFAAEGLPVFEMRTKKANLEDVFLELTESSVGENVPSTGVNANTVCQADQAEATVVDLSGEAAAEFSPEESLDNPTENNESEENDR